MDQAANIQEARELVKSLSARYTKYKEEKRAPSVEFKDDVERLLDLVEILAEDETLPTYWKDSGFKILDDFRDFYSSYESVE